MRLGLVRRQESGEDRGRLVPLARFTLDLLSAGTSQLIELRLAVVVGDAPRRLDVALLFELQQCRIERAVVDEQLVSAGLLDPARDAVAVLWPERFECLQNHQRERALPDVGFTHPSSLVRLKADTAETVSRRRSIRRADESRASRMRRSRPSASPG